MTDFVAYLVECCEIAGTDNPSADFVAAMRYAYERGDDPLDAVTEWTESEE